MDIEITINSEINGDDLKKFMIFDALKKQKRWVRPSVFAIIFYISAIICILIGRKNNNSTILIITLFIVGTLLPFSYIFSFLMASKKEAQKFGKESKVVYNVKLSNDTKGIFISTKKEKAYYSFEDVTGIYKNLDFYYLYIQNKRAFILPIDKIKQILC